MPTVETGSSRRSSTLRYAGFAVAGTAAVAIALSACGGGSKKASSPQTVPSSNPSGAVGGNGGANAPAASGTAAAVSASSVEVQNDTTGQVTVNFSSSTKFTETKASSLAAVQAGVCVTAATARTSSSGSSSSPSAVATTFTAATVLISRPVSGSCTTNEFGVNPGDGALPSGAGTPPNGGAFPSGAAPSGAASGARPSGAGGGFGDRASGKVTAVSGSRITVQGTARNSSTTTTYRVTVTSSTTYTATVTATSKALVVGRCVTAIGEADSTGAVTATRIGVSTASANGCSTAFGRRNGASGGVPTNG